ncbi:MAG: hypothetical protein EOP09_00020 [Proteobacteria bacterium]|nr:MAG: hypothetical protein EOP09_00020 [Pseudomonadota bacterium]
MNYKVLWIDDDYKTQIDFIGEAEQEGIDIIPFESHEEGFAHLKRHKETFHAVILDAKVKHKKDDNRTGLDGLRASRDRLIEINKSEYLPYFIFTGQPDYVKAEWFLESYGKYYIKSDDNEALFTDLKEAVERKAEYIIQKKYKAVFETCTDKYIGLAASKLLLELLVQLEAQKEVFNDESYFNGLRKIVEYAFRAANRWGILHDKCIPNGIVNLTWSSLFLSGNEVELRPSTEKISHTEKPFPLILANNVKSILDITSAASHTEEEKLNGKVNFSQYKSQIKSHYLLASLTFQVMDLILWFRDYVDGSPDIEKNKLQWKPADKLDQNTVWVKGSITRIASNGFGTFQPVNGNKTLSIVPYIITQHSLKEHQFIEVITQPDLTGTKTFIKEIRVI